MVEILFARRGGGNSGEGTETDTAILQPAYIFDNGCGPKRFGSKGEVERAKTMGKTYSQEVIGRNQEAPHLTEPQNLVRVCPRYIRGSGAISAICVMEPQRLVRIARRTLHYCFLGLAEKEEQN